MQIPVFKNLDDLQNHYYGSLNGVLNKADSFTNTSSAGYFNRKYGGFLWTNINFEGNVASILPKVPYKRSGYRLVNDPVKLDTDHTAEYTARGGTRESGEIADATIPSIATIKYKPKITQLAFGTSVVHQWLADNSEDDVAGSLESLRIFMAENFTLNMAESIGLDVESNTNAMDRTDAANRALPQELETIDRIISSSAEEDAVGGAGSHHYNPWQDTVVNRDSNEKFDCYVSSATGGEINSGNARLSKKLLINTIAKIKRAGGGKPSVCIGNQEVGAQVQQLYEQNTRYAMGETMVQYGVNGIETAKGHNVGIQIASLYGTPLVESQHLNGNPNDSDEIGRLYFLDTSSKNSAGIPRICMAIAVPPMYNELGAVNGQAGGVLTLGSFNNKAIYWTMSEVIASRFRGHGKIRDIGE